MLVCAKIIYQKYLIHRIVAIAFLYNPDNKPHVDHINNNRKDNNVINLRFATSHENQRNRSISSRNTSMVKGVYFDKEKKKWRSRIKLNRKNIHIGYYNTLEEAKNARQSRAKELFGEYINKCEL